MKKDGKSEPTWPNLKSCTSIEGHIILYPDIRIDNKVIQGSIRGTMLGLELARTCISAHVKIIKARVEMDFRKLWGLRKLKEEKRRMLFKALISSKVTYPPVPLLCINKTTMTTLQRIHNKKE